MFAVNRFLLIYFNVRYITLFDIKKLTKVNLGICFGIGVFANALVIYFLEKDLEKTLKFNSVYSWLGIPGNKMLNIIMIYIPILIYSYKMG